MNVEMVCERYSEGWKSEEGGWIVRFLFLGWLDSLAVLACDNLNLLSLDHLVRLHLERRVLDYERPDVVTQTVRFQMALKDERLGWIEQYSGFTEIHTLRVVLVLTCLTMVSAKDLSNYKGKSTMVSGITWNSCSQTCWRTFIAS